MKKQCYTSKAASPLQGSKESEASKIPYQQLTDYQTSELERMYKIDHHPKLADRLALADNLGITLEKVDNRLSYIRRTEKKEGIEDQQGTSRGHMVNKSLSIKVLVSFFLLCTFLLRIN